MAVNDLPDPVVNLLNVIDVPRLHINEDLACQFGQAVAATHQDDTGAVAGIANAHPGWSTQVMYSGWANASDLQVKKLVTIR